MSMGIRLQDRVTNQEILDRAGSTNIGSVLLKAQLRWTGHAVRMSDSRIPRRPKLRFKDTLKSKLKWSGISPCELEVTAADRSAWRSLTSRTAAAFDENRRHRLAAKRDRRHGAASASTRTADYRRDTCGRSCASSFGLRSYMLFHR